MATTKYCAQPDAGQGLPQWIVNAFWATLDRHGVATGVIGTTLFGMDDKERSQLSHRACEYQLDQRSECEIVRANVGLGSV